MKYELQIQLFDKYPKLFENRTIKYSPMAFGVECGDGWYDLISSVCWRISQHEQNIADRKRLVPTDTTEYFPVKFDQIKEKFGGLRLYFSGGDDYITGITSMAEEYSYKVCEICGNKGTPNDGGWISTRCESCRDNGK